LGDEKKKDLGEWVKRGERGEKVKSSFGFLVLSFELR